MLKHKSLLLSTRRGNVIRLVREHYVRTNIDTRLPGHSENPFTTEGAKFIISLDAETILNQIDALQHPKFVNVVILQTVYDIVKNKSRSIQHRLDRILSTPEKHFMLFANEHLLETFVEQQKDQTLKQTQDQSILTALNYLNGIFPVIHLVNFDKDKEFLNSKGDMIKYQYKTIHEFADDDIGLSEVLTTVNVFDASEAPIYEGYLPIIDVQRMIKSGEAGIGLFSLSQFSREEATVRTEKEEIIITNKKNQNRAIEGDKVAVQILPQTEWFNVNGELFPTGKVVSIVQSPKRTICGTVEAPAGTHSDWQNVLVVPMDPSFPKIRIRTRQVEQLVGCRVEVAIDGWRIDSKYPHGHYIATIGNAGDIHTESEVILLSHQIPHHSFPPAVIDCLPPDDFVCPPDERPRRRDLTDRLVCSIDPRGCTDIDDALHYCDLNDTECEVGIHIADVSYFVREGTAIDLEARERGTTVYLVEQRIHMLPSLLSENLCSIRENVERLAFSVVAIMDKRTGETKDVWFGKTLIRSRRSLAYDQAQAIVEDESDKSDLACSIRGLLNLSKILKQKRVDNGAVRLSSPQLHFVLDSETNEPLNGEQYQHLDVNSLIEEFMLYANIEVAKHIYSVFPQSACLRRHEPPLAARFDYLNRALKRFGVQIDPENNHSLVNTLDDVTKKRSSLDDIVRILTTRCMQRAKYFASGTQNYDNFRHFGLAMPIYTHFTSPIRRYADLLVHRQLAAAVGYDPSSQTLTSKLTMSLISDNLNFRHRMAQEAGRASSQLFMMELFRKTPGLIQEGKVIKIKPTVFVILLEQYGVEGHVHVDGKEWIYSEVDECLSRQDRIIRIFDPVKVHVNVSPINVHGRSRLDLQIVEE